jgi:glycerol uptake facilitator protein
MNPYLAEFIGTALLILFGNGVVANVVLARTKGNNGGWIVITAGWGLAVFIGAFCAAPFSGAHLNPAVTLAMALTGKLETAKVAGYIVAQMLGGILGGVLVFLPMPTASSPAFAPRRISATFRKPFSVNSSARSA